MASPESSYLEYAPNRARRRLDRESPVVAVPWTLTVTVEAGKRQRLNFLNVTRSLTITSESSFGLAFSSADADPLAATELVVVGGNFSEQVQVTGLWLVNRSTLGVEIGVFAVLGPDPSERWPVYSLSDGFDAVDEEPTLPAAVSLPA